MISIGYCPLNTFFFNLKQFSRLLVSFASLAELYLNETAIITPHAQRERGKVIDRGVHIYMSVVEKNI